MVFSRSDFAKHSLYYTRSLKNMQPSVPTRPKRPKKSAFEITLDKHKYIQNVEKTEELLLRLENAKLRLKEHRRQEVLKKLEESRQRLARIEEKMAIKKLKKEAHSKKKNAKATIDEKEEADDSVRYLFYNQFFC
jgi:hypothetical protein